MTVSSSTRTVRIRSRAFDLERDQLSYLIDEFVPHAMPHGYVNNFLFLPS